MSEELTIHEHIGTDGVLHLDLPKEWQDRDVIVTVEPNATQKSAPSGTLADALKWAHELFSFRSRRPVQPNQ